MCANPPRSPVCPPVRLACVFEFKRGHFSGSLGVLKVTGTIETDTREMSSLRASEEPERDTRETWFNPVAARDRRAAAEGTSSSMLENQN